MGCPLCAWTMARVGKAVDAHRLRSHLRGEHGLCLAETVAMSRRSAALSQSP
jgi:hypothetical protein